MKKIALSIALVAMMSVSFVSCKDTAKEPEAPVTEEVAPEAPVTEEVAPEAPATEEVAPATEEAPATEAPATEAAPAK